jgi:hypothetical protein
VKRQLLCVFFKANKCSWTEWLINLESIQESKIKIWEPILVFSWYCKSNAWSYIVVLSCSFGMRNQSEFFVIVLESKRCGTFYHMHLQILEGISPKFPCASYPVLDFLPQLKILMILNHFARKVAAYWDIKLRVKHESWLWPGKTKGKLLIKTNKTHILEGRPTYCRRTRNY